MDQVSCPQYVIKEIEGQMKQVTGEMATAKVKFESLKFQEYVAHFPSLVSITFLYFEFNSHVLPTNDKRKPKKTETRIQTTRRKQSFKLIKISFSSDLPIISGYLMLLSNIRFTQMILCLTFWILIKAMMNCKL